MKIHRSLIVAITITVLVFSVLFPVPAYAEGEPPADPISPGLAPTDFPVSVDSGASNSDSKESNSETTSDSAPTAAEAGTSTETQPVADSVPTGLLPTDFPVSVDSTGDGSTGDETETSTEAQPSADSVPTGLLPTDFPVTSDPAISESAPPAESVPEILASIPPETSLALTDANGNLQSLGSEAGSQILVNGDPTWCPNSDHPGSAGCIGPFASFSQLIDNLGGASGNGTIYVSWDYTSIAEADYATLIGAAVPQNIVFDSVALPTLNDLIIQGGWDFTGDQTQDQVVGTSTINGLGLKVGLTAGSQWNGSVTLKDLVVQLAPSRGIEINASGNVVLQNVTSDTNNLSDSGNRAGIYAVAGGDIDANQVNSSNTRSQSGGSGPGAVFFADGSIEVKNSTFYNNTGFGLYVHPGMINQLGTHTLIDMVDVTYNTQEAMTVVTDDNTDNVIQIRNSVFYLNGAGIQVNTFGSVELDNVWVYNNADVSNLSVSGPDPGTISIANSHFDGYPAYYSAGTNISGASAVTISGSSFNDNDTYGLLMSGAPGYTAQVTDSFFNGNVDTGLWAFGPGTITLNNVVAQSSVYGSGVDIWGSAGQSNVTVNGGSFNYNGSNGIKFYQDDTSVGNITLNNVQAIGNKGSSSWNAGAYLIVNNGAVSINGGNFSGNSGYGFYAETYPVGINGGYPGSGQVIVDNVTASGNAYDGGRVIFDSNSGVDTGDTPVPVTVSNSTFNSNGNFGLYTRAGGAITLAGVTANSNSYSGAWLGSGYDGYGGWVTVDNSTLAGNAEYGIVSTPSSYTHADPRDGTLFLTNVVMPGNGLGCYYLIDGSVVETNVLCAVVAGDAGGGGGGGGDEANGTDKKRLPQTGVYNPGSQELSINEVSATSGTPVALDCQNFSATSFNLPGGADAILGCPFGDKGMITQLVKDKLPGEMPAKFTFIQSLGVDVMLGGVTFPPMAVNGRITVQFPIPAGSEGKKLAIMFWDPSLNAGAGGWTELQMRVLNPDGTDKTFPLRNPPDGLTILTGVYQENGLITVVTNFPGVFMLVAK